MPSKEEVGPTISDEFPVNVSACGVAPICEKRRRLNIPLEKPEPPTEIVLVYPHEFLGEKGQVNVIAPIGAAILGLSEGQEIEWPQPDGHLMKVKIEKVLYQPEREGHYL